MNKTELIDALAARFEGNRKAAAHALDAVLDTITREVARGEKVAITGFGSFEKRIREAREVRNPRTGEKLMSDRIAIPKFSAGADLKSVVAGLRELPQLAFDTAAAALPDAIKPGKSSSSSDAASTPAPAKKATPAEKAPAKKAPAKKTTAKKSTAKKTTAKRTTTTAKKTASTAAKKTTSTAAGTTAAATKTAAKKTPAKKTPAKKTTAKKTTAKKTTAKKTTAKKSTS